MMTSPTGSLPVMQFSVFTVIIHFTDQFVCWPAVQSIAVTKAFASTRINGTLKNN